MARTATSPSGESWRVHAAWFRSPRLRGAPDGGVEAVGEGAFQTALDFIGVEELPVLGILIAVAVVLLVAIVFVLPLAFFALEAAVLFLAGAVGRIVLRRPFPVVVTADDGRARSTLVTGPIRSHRAVGLIVEAIRRGDRFVDVPGGDPERLFLPTG